MNPLDLSTTTCNDIDPIAAEVLRYVMLAIPKQVDTNITKTAYSPLIYEYKDFAVGLVDREGKLIAQGGASAPVFVANALGIAVQDGLAVLGPEGMAPGDIMLLNHSGTLGQHLNNVVAYTPIYVGKDIFAFMACVVHWIDLGGGVMGSSASPFAAEIFQEGIQLRHVKLWSGDKPNKEIYSTIEANTRMPRELLGDIEAQVAGCFRGRDLFLDVLAKYGAPTVRKAIELMWDRAEAAVRATVRDIPDGVYRAQSLLDDDPANPGVPISVKVAVTVNHDILTVDFTGTAPQAKGAINSGREGGAVAAARIAFKYLTSSLETANFGTFRPLNVEIPNGTFLSAGPHAPMGLYNTVLPTVIDTILKAMVPVLPERLAGGHHGALQGTVITGILPETGDLFMHMDTCLGGWGACLGRDGPGPYKTMTHGDTLEVPIELVELLYPVRVENYAIRPDSGGAGEFRGGNGIEKIFLALAPCRFMWITDRTVCPAWGVLGGRDALPGSAFLERPGTAPELLTRETVQLKAGDRVRVLTGGGGGYGDPLKRDPIRVAADVHNGYISVRAATDMYGVVLGDRGQVLALETKRRRIAMSA